MQVQCISASVCLAQSVSYLPYTRRWGRCVSLLYAGSLAESDHMLDWSGGGFLISPSQDKRAHLQLTGGGCATDGGGPRML